MATRSAVSDWLGKAELFAGLSREVLAAIADAMRQEAYTAGQTIFSRSEPGANLYLITDGRVRISVSSIDGRELTFRYVEAGDVMGEIAAIDQGPRTADALAVTDVAAHVLSAAQLKRLMDVHPQIARPALNFVCARLRDTTTQLEEIALYPIERRVARFLVSALMIAGRDMSAADVPLDLKMNQSELALLLGASRPKVNVALGALSQAGAITRTGDAIICHPAALKAFAGMD